MIQGSRSLSLLAGLRSNEERRSVRRRHLVAGVLPYLATLLTLEVRGELAERVKYLDGEAMGRQIFLTARRFFERLAHEGPLVLVLEDWHWADQSSAALLEHLLPLVESVPLLICCVSRPGDHSAVAHLREIAARDYTARYTETTLSPLSQTDSARLIDHLLHLGDAAARVREAIVEKAEGNPFYVEEVIRSLIDQRAVTKNEATGRWQATVGVEQIAIPDTLQGVITARVDRLDEDLKEVLRLAAVIGRSFFGLGFHHFGLADIKKTLECFQRAAAAYREAGELRGWGIITDNTSEALRFLGDFPRSLELSQELVRVGRDGADRQVLGLGLMGSGLTLSRVGALDEAAAHLQEATKIFKAIPDYHSLLYVGSGLGQCYLRQGLLKQALAVLEDGVRLIADHDLRGSACFEARNHLAEAYLAVAEQAAAGSQARSLKKARSACRAAVRQSTVCRVGLPTAWRLQGTCEWLTGRPGHAQKCWQQSLALAEARGMRCERGLTHLEMGRRLGNRDDLERAEAIFADIGASFDLDQTRELLKPCPAHLPRYLLQ